jgi:hypothetical protein
VSAQPFLTVTASNGTVHLQEGTTMTWQRTITVPAEQTFREAAEQVDISDLSPEYQQQFDAAVRTAENLIAVDEVPSTADESCTLDFTGYISGTYRSLSVSVGGFDPPTVQPAIDYDPMRDGHGQQ